MVVTVGLAVTVVPVVALKPVAGAQAYVAAPAPVNVILLPKQIAPEFTVTVNTLITVTVAIAVFVHPFASVPVTV